MSHRSHHPHHSGNRGAVAPVRSRQRLLSTEDTRFSTSEHGTRRAALIKALDKACQSSDPAVCRLRSRIERCLKRNNTLSLTDFRALHWRLQSDSASQKIVDSFRSWPNKPTDFESIARKNLDRESGTRQRQAGLGPEGHRNRSSALLPIS